MTTLSDLEQLLTITHSAVSRDIVARRAGQRYYMVRGLYHFSGRDPGHMITLDETVHIHNAPAVNGPTPAGRE